MKYNDYCLVLTIAIVSSMLIACSANNESVGTRQAMTGASSKKAKTIMAKDLPLTMTVVSQCLNLSDKLSVLLERGGDNACVSQFSSFNNSACSGKPVETSSAGQRSKLHFEDIKKHFVDIDTVSPLDDGNHCSELRILRQAGLCKQWDFISGGDGYLLCTFPYAFPLETRPGIECVFPYSGKCAQ